MATKLTAGQRLERSRRTTHAQQHRQKLEQQANQSRLVSDRATANAYRRAEQTEARQRASAEAQAARIAQTERTRRIGAVQSSLPSSNNNSGTFSPIGGTSTSGSVGRATGSVGHSVALILAVITGVAVIYLMVSNGGQGGSVIINGINNFLTGLTSGQPLFKPAGSSNQSQAEAQAQANANNSIAGAAVGGVPVLGPIIAPIFGGK